MNAKQVAVIGAGTMGSGIAQLAASSGHDVHLYDISDAALDRSAAAVRSSLLKLADKGRLSGATPDDVQARIATTTELPQAVETAGIVIEAAPELLDLKQRLFAQVVEVAPADCLLGTNTSQLSITAVGAHLGEDAARLVGIHFFNPPVLMQLVELVRGLRTSDAALERARSFAQDLGREVVVCQKDSPGFLTSRVSAILRLECIRMLEEGLASADDIDKAMRLGFNHPMGPLELGDFNGHDTYLHILESLEGKLGDRFRPPVMLRNMVAAGQLGRKSGSGFYDYTSTTDGGAA